MIDFYYWPTPNGWKVSILLEELGVAYRLITVNIGKGEQFTPEFMAISPNHRMPAIVDPDVDGDPVPVFESGAIMLYLAEKHGRFLPVSASSQSGTVALTTKLYGGNGTAPRMEAEPALRTEKGRNEYRFSLAHAHPEWSVRVRAGGRFPGSRHMGVSAMRLHRPARPPRSLPTSICRASARTR